MSLPKRSRFSHILNCISALLGAVFCITDDDNQQISSITYEKRYTRKSWWYTYKTLNHTFAFLFGDEDHCKENWEAENRKATRRIMRLSGLDEEWAKRDQGLPWRKQKWTRK